MTFRADGQQFLVWNQANETKRFIRAYDVTTGRQVWSSAMVHTNGELRVCTEPTGRWFGYFGYNDAARLRLMDFQKYEEFGATTVGYEAISPSGHEFAGLWNFYPDSRGLKNAIPLAKDWHPLGFVWSFSPDARRLVCGTAEGPVLVADLTAVQRRLVSLKTSP